MRRAQIKKDLIAFVTMASFVWLWWWAAVQLTRGVAG